jgi:hypothetical protein
VVYSSSRERSVQCGHVQMQKTIYLHLRQCVKNRGGELVENGLTVEGSCNNIVYELFFFQ